MAGAEEGRSHAARRHGNNAGACRREKQRREAVGEQQSVPCLRVPARPRACSGLPLFYEGTCCARSTATANRLTTSKWYTTRRTRHTLRKTDKLVDRLTLSAQLLNGKHKEVITEEDNFDDRFPIDFCRFAFR